MVDDVCVVPFIARDRRIGLMYPVDYPRHPSRVLLKRGFALLAAAFVPSSRQSTPVAGKRGLFYEPAGSSLAHSSSSSSSAGMASKTSIFAHELGRHARHLRGELSMEPATALGRLVPELDENKHKGQLGRVGIFGGSKDYTGAPFYASISSLRMGADLAYVFTAQEAAPAIKAYSPELMVTPVYSASNLPDNGEAVQKQLVEAVAAMFPKLHSLLLGPGLGRDPNVLRAAADIVQKASLRNLPVVLDADSIALVEQNLGAVRGCPYVVLTPNANEFRHLCEWMDRDIAEQGDHSPMEEGAATVSTGVIEKKEVEDSSGKELESKSAAVERLADHLGGAIIVLKGKEDIISDGSRTIVCAVPGGLKRCGGIGDVLSGVMATSLAWVSLQKPDKRETEELRLWAAWWACAMTRHASRRGYEAYGRAMSATNVYEMIGGVVEDVLPSPAVED